MSISSEDMMANTHECYLANFWASFNERKRGGQMSTTSEKIKVMQHFEDGGEVEVKFAASNHWDFVANPNPLWDWHKNDYRIKQPNLKSVDDFDWDANPKVKTIAVDGDGELKGWDHNFIEQANHFTVDPYWAGKLGHGGAIHHEHGYDASDWQNSIRKRPSEKVKFDRLEEEIDTSFYPGETEPEDPFEYIIKANKAINEIQQYLEKQ